MCIPFGVLSSVIVDWDISLSGVVLPKLSSVCVTVVSGAVLATLPVVPAEVDFSAANKSKLY